MFVYDWMLITYTSEWSGHAFSKTWRTPNLINCVEEMEWFTSLILWKTTKSTIKGQVGSFDVHLPFNPRKIHAKTLENLRNLERKTGFDPLPPSSLQGFFIVFWARELHQASLLQASCRYMKHWAMPNNPIIGFRKDLKVILIIAGFIIKLVALFQIAFLLMFYSPALTVAPAGRTQRKASETRAGKSFAAGFEGLVNSSYIRASFQKPPVL